MVGRLNINISVVRSYEVHSSFDVGFNFYNLDCTPSNRNSFGSSPLGDIRADDLQNMNITNRSYLLYI